MNTVAIDRPDTRLAQRLCSLQRRAGTDVARAAAPGADFDCLVVTGAGPGRDVDGSGRGGVALEESLNLLEASSARTIVVVSSALVYGAWDDNPVPLTEDAPLRPRPESRHVAALCELERAAHETRLAREGVTVAVLRPTVCVDPAATGSRRSRAAGASRWLERSLWHARSQRPEGEDRPAQFLHIDDLARAIEHARLHRLDGVFNVAPPGWLSAEEQLELVGSVRAVRVPGLLRRALMALRWRLGTVSTPSEVIGYTRHTWVISSDRLRATGWRATYTNEEAFVLGHRPGWWSTLNPDQRQLVSLGGLGAGALVASWGAVGLIRRAVRGGPAGDRR